jgi:AcrR family transcriptional regulator
LAEGDNNVAAESERARDRGVARRQAFLKAAREVFFELGYDAASVNDVVARAGGSLATLYAQFGNKEGLFQAVVRDQFERLRQDINAETVKDLPLEKGLIVLGEQILQIMMQPDNLAFNRLLVNEGRRFPEFVLRVATSGADVERFGVARYLQDRSRLDGQPIEDPATLAQYFISMLRSRHMFTAITDPNYTLTHAEMKEHVASTVRLLLHGALPRGSN